MAVLVAGEADQTAPGAALRRHPDQRRPQPTPLSGGQRARPECQAPGGRRWRPCRASPHRVRPPGGRAAQGRRSRRRWRRPEAMAAREVRAATVATGGPGGPGGGGGGRRFGRSRRRWRRRWRRRRRRRWRRRRRRREGGDGGEEVTAAKEVTAATEATAAEAVVVSVPTADTNYQAPSFRSCFRGTGNTRRDRPPRVPRGRTRPLKLWLR